MGATTNIDGSNPGPNVVTLPDTVQYPVGNLWKVGTFQLNITPAAVAADTAPFQAFADTGIGLLVGDAVTVGVGSGLTPEVNVAIADAYVSAADTLSIRFVNPTAAAITPTKGNYQVTVLRPLPEWSSGGSVQMDW